MEGERPMTTEYVCNNGHKFLHPAILTVESKLTVSTAIDGNTLASHVCPECHSAEISVAPEENIVSVKSVPLEEVDTWLAEGYKVRELYAKTATLIKTAAPVNPELATHDASVLDVNDQ